MQVLFISTHCFLLTLLVLYIQCSRHNELQHEHPDQCSETTEDTVLIPKFRGYTKKFKQNIKNIQNHTTLACLAPKQGESEYDLVLQRSNVNTAATGNCWVATWSHVIMTGQFKSMSDEEIWQFFAAEGYVRSIREAFFKHRCLVDTTLAETGRFTPRYR